MMVGLCTSVCVELIFVNDGGVVYQCLCTELIFVNDGGVVYQCLC